MLKKQKETNPQKKLPENPPNFFAQQVKHQYGTCWSCGHARETPGGSPGGRDTYWCSNCQKWLTVRIGIKDTRLVDLIITKESKSKAKSKVVSDRYEDPAVYEIDIK